MLAGFDGGGEFVIDRDSGRDLVAGSFAVRNGLALHVPAFPGTAPAVSAEFEAFADVFRGLGGKPDFDAVFVGVVADGDLVNGRRGGGGFGFRLRGGEFGTQLAANLTRR